MRIEVTIHPTATTAFEAAAVELQLPEGEPPFTLDINFTELLRHSHNISDLAKDFLLIGAVIYGCDKAIDRENGSISDDRWTRELVVNIPVQFPDRWEAVAEDLSECVSFLTGDSWEFEFSLATRDIVQRRRRRQRQRRRLVNQEPVHAVSLFSGGLDSLIGALDWLSNNANERVFLVGHYDPDLKGPKHDQLELAQILGRHFPNRFEVVHGRIGVNPAGDDINLRSRSFLFVALATFFAEQFGPTVPIIVPENGPIALNLPLTPSRRGSCSTRTVHPHFLDLLRQVMTGVGFHHPIENPYRFKTKGEMAAECCVPAILEEGYSHSRSCAKGGHKSSWNDRHAKGCGRCVPCLFRRAALHVTGCDDESYGIDVCGRDVRTEDLNSDFLSLLSFLRRNDTERELKRSLLAHGLLRSTNFPHTSE